MDFKFWAMFAIQVVGLLLVGWQVRIMSTQAPDSLSGVAALIRLWPLAVMGLLVILNGLFAYLVLSRVPPEDKRPAIRGVLISSYGVGAKTYVATINGESLLDFQDKYNFAIVCGMIDPKVDKIEDDRTTVSAVYTITRAPFNVHITFSGKHAEAIDQLVEAAAPPQVLKTEQAKKGEQQLIVFGVSMPQWAETILLPKGVSPKEIHRLSDVKRFNGIVITQDILDGKIRQIPFP